MLPSVSLRLCWIAAMAPALTEAAPQADNFNIPASSNLNFASPSLHKLGDLSLHTLSEIVSGKHKLPPRQLSGSEGLPDDSQIQKCRMPWKLLHADGYSKHGSILPLNGRNGLDHEALKSNRLVGLTPHGDLAGHNMNKNNQHLPDSMGLIKANTSLESSYENKVKPVGSMPVMGHSEPAKNFPTNDRNCNATLRRLTISENFKNFQWSKLPKEETLDVEQVEGDVFSQNSTLSFRARQVLRRIRKLQLRCLQCHTKDQLKSFVEHQQSSLGVPCQRQLESQLLRARSTEELKAELLQSEDVKLLSTAALVNLVRKLEHGTSLAQSRNMCETVLNKDRRRTATRADPTECHEIKQTSTGLLGSIRYLESAADSDATESSSGGESTDELTDSEELIRPDVLSKRQATIRWAEDRASAASQWTWLQAQVSDLEYKIRQQNDLYRQVRASKGALTLEGIRRDKTTSDSNRDAHSATSDIGVVPKSVNGFLDGVSNGYSAVRRLVMTDPDSQKLLESGCESCRTLPLKRGFRKRKLVRTVGLHLAGRKTSRLSSVKCGCNSQRELLPCVLCGGRYSNTQTLDPEVMPLKERIALLDSSYHMVLSFKQDTPLSLHLEKLLRRDEYCKVLKMILPIKKKSRIAIGPLRFSDQARKHSQKLAKNAAQTLLTSAKLRKKLGAQTRRSRHGRFLMSNREDPGYRKKFKTLAAYRRRRTRRRSGSFSSESSKPGSPVPSLLSCGPDSGGKVSLQELLRRRRLDSAYDINNIVIPYSIAAATRVEKLQYKEILTPKWRLVESSDLPSEGQPPLDDEEPEDMSDENFAIRHLKCEVEEKKRFLGYKQMHGRSRLRSIRGDGRCDSSGANTPDRVSPHPPDTFSHDSYDWNSPVASPPPTPVLVQMEDLGLPSQPAACLPLRSERRRTISLSKRLSEDDRSSIGEDIAPAATPYDRRTFPLTDEDFQEMQQTSLHLEHSPRHPSLSSPGGSSDAGSVPNEDLDDPDDPEWTVVVEDKQQKPSLILKLAKR